ncbi:VCBS domain-containing protein [Microbulbifer sp. TRSA002]|uniref:VCBS domain-containing protein n=1 Tax=Microbulbifer sp. TRSA002 TaxID=3243382 RepID=UPI0040394DD2
MNNIGMISAAILLSVLAASCGGGGADSNSDQNTDESSVGNGNSGGGNSGGGNSGGGNSGGGNSGGGNSGGGNDSGSSDDSGDTSPNQITGGSGRISENLEERVSGKLSSDTNSEIQFTPGSFQGVYGELEVSADGSWVYVLDDLLSDPIQGEEVVSDNFDIGIQASSETTPIVIAIVGFDDPYEFNVETPIGTLVVGDSEYLTGTLTISDIDGNAPTFNDEAIEGEYGEFNINENGDWEYRLNEKADEIPSGTSVTETVELSLSDNSSQLLTFSINTIKVKESSIVFIYMEFDGDSSLDILGISDLANRVFNNSDSMDNVYYSNSFGQHNFVRHRAEDSSLENYCYGSPGQYTSSIDCVIFNVPDEINGDMLSYQEIYDRVHLGGRYTDKGLSFRDEATAWAKENLVDENNEPLDLGKWDHRVYLYPKAIFGASAIAATWGGWSLIGLDYGPVRGIDFIQHEVGHNFGLAHANFDSNNDGDASDGRYGGLGIMGYGYSKIFGSGQREFLGWYESFPGYTSVVTPSAGVFQEAELQSIYLGPGELSKDIPQQIKIRSEGSSHGKDYYYINYHTRHSIMNPSQSSPSVVVSYADDGAYNDVVRLKSLGESFTDPMNGLVIKFESVDAVSGYAKISVKYSN